MNSATKNTLRFVIFLLIPLLLLPAIQARAGGKAYGDVVVTRVISVHDGDTFRCDVDPWQPIIGSRIAVRVNGVDTPEMNDTRPEIREKAIAAKQFVIGKLQSAKVIELRNVKRGKYFRIVADIYVDGKSLAEMLLDAGLARPYDGGKK